MSDERPAIAVIGAAGFLGSALVRAARAANIDCASFTRQVAFLDDAGRPARGLRDADTIYWLAGSVTPALAERDPDRIAADAAALAALLAVAGELGQRPRVVLVSSGGTVYDPAVPPPYRESSPVRPVGGYGRAKFDQERLLAAADLGSSVTIRVSNVYGPGQQARFGQGVIGHWLRAVAAGEPLTVMGDGTATRDYVYVDDVAEALLAAGAGTPPPTINVGSGRATTLTELAELIHAITGDVRPIVYQPARTFDVGDTWLDIGLAQRALGWRPRTSLADGLALSWKAVLDR